MQNPKKIQAAGTDLVDEVVEGFRHERPDLDALTIQTVCRLIYTGRIMEQRATKSLDAFGMNYTDLDVLGTLRRTPRPHELAPADLIRSVMITSGAMTACLDRLETKGCITRHISADDRRGRKIRLTANGKSLIDQVLTRRFGEAQASLSVLSETHLKTLNSLLRRVLNTAMD
ncbi:MAG: MarR family transcriptional regulator [Opitutaceae bacterium]|nr:MarR family transcriptional regulator [Opitutaceae bacterium]